MGCTTCRASWGTANGQDWSPAFPLLRAASDASAEQGIELSGYGEELACSGFGSAMECA